jgi:hypothetical protein
MGPSSAAALLSEDMDAWFEGGEAGVRALEEGAVAAIQVKSESGCNWVDISQKK